MAKSVGKSLAIISSSIFASRVFGLLRDIVIASCFGAGRLTDVFFVAFRIPNMLRRIFAEGAFSSAFTPAFAKKLVKDRHDAYRFACEFFFFLLISLTSVLFFGEIFAPVIVKLVAPGFKGQAFFLAVKLTREMFPYIFLVSLVAFFGGILNGFEHFFAPAFSTVLFNISVIVSALLLKNKLSIDALAVGVVAGGVFQVWLQVIYLRRFSFLVKPIPKISQDVVKAAKNIIPGIFAYGVRQLSMLTDTIIASFLGAGAISFLYYANRFVQLPLGVFAVGLSQVLLPKLAKESEAEKNFKKTLELGLKLCSAVIIPASLGLIFFGKPVIDLIFHHGKFTVSDLNDTYLVLVGYSCGLLFYSAEKILVNAYYSLDEYTLPVKITAATLLFNVAADLLLCFVFHMGAMGLALGTSLTSLLNVAFLLLFFKLRFKMSPKFLRDAFRYLILSTPVALLSYEGSRFYFTHDELFFKISVVLGVILLAVALYALALLASGDELLKKLLER